MLDNQHSLKVFRDDWSAAEELALLEAVEKHGIGNWKEIADQVGTKNERRVEEHYLDDYLGRYGTVLPAKALVHGQPVDTDTLLAEDDRCVAGGGGAAGASRSRFLGLPAAHPPSPSRPPPQPPSQPDAAAAADPLAR